MTTRTPERDAKILELWNSGLTSGQIAAKLKLESRNVVIGAVARARNRGETVVSVNAKEKAKRSADAGSFLKHIPVGDTSRRRRQAQAVSGSGITTAKNGNGGYVPARWPAATGCQYPEGEPGTKGFRFCSAPRVPHRYPYCQLHLERCCDSKATREAYERAMAADVRARA